MGPRGQRHEETCCPGPICKGPEFKGSTILCIWCFHPRRFLGIFGRLPVTATLPSLSCPFHRRAVNTSHPSAVPNLSERSERYSVALRPGAQGGFRERNLRLRPSGRALCTAHVRFVFPSPRQQRVERRRRLQRRRCKGRRRRSAAGRGLDRAYFGP